MVASLALAIGAATVTPAEATIWRTSQRVCVESHVATDWHVRRSIQDWNRSAYGPNFYLSGHCGSTSRVMIRPRRLPDRNVGETYVSGTHIDIYLDRHKATANYPKRWRDCLRHNVAAHELGHALGLRHYVHSHSGQVMSYLGWTKNCGTPTSRDYSDLARLYKK